MVFNAQNVTSACVLLWTIAFYCITAKPVACALGYGFIQSVLMVFVHQRIDGGVAEYALLEVGLMSTFVLVFFLTLDKISNSEGIWKAALVAGTAIALAGNFVFVPRLDEFLRRERRAPVSEWEFSANMAEDLTRPRFPRASTCLDGSADSFRIDPRA